MSMGGVNSTRSLARDSADDSEMGIPESAASAGAGRFIGTCDIPFVSAFMARSPVRHEFGAAWSRELWEDESSECRRRTPPRPYLPERAQERRATAPSFPRPVHACEIDRRRLRQDQVACP